MTKEECYKILGAKLNASEEQLRHYYNRLLKKYHPDTYQGDKQYATEKTMQIVEAYKTINKNFPPQKNLNNQTQNKTTKQEKVKKQKQPKQNKKQTSDKPKIKAKKPKMPAKAIDSDVIVIGVLCVVLVVLLIIFANL